MKRLLIAAALACAVTPIIHAGTLLPIGEAAPQWDELFQRKEGWIGADGNYSVPMGDDRTLWLFSDTWVGEVNEGRRENARMINNSIALQTGQEVPEFFYRTKEDGSANSFITPADGRGFFWLFGGVRTEAGVYLFLRQVEIVKPGTVFGFQGIGAWLGHVKNPDAPPLEWEIEQQKMPCAIYTDEGARTFGAAALHDEGFIYIYGNEDRRDEGRKQGVLLARVREEDFGSFSKWRYYSDGEWEEDFTRATPICPPVASEYSVSFLPALEKYVMVYTEAIWGRNVLRTAPSPIGPWSDPTEFYRAPEMDWPGKIFCYAGKAHPQLAGADELLVTYASNSFESAEVIGDARLYWPRFVRVKFLPANPD